MNAAYSLHMQCSCNKIISPINKFSVKVHTFWEGDKILRNLHQLFDWQYIGQIISQSFVAFSEYMNFNKSRPSDVFWSGLQFMLISFQILLGCT